MERVVAGLCLKINTRPPCDWCCLCANRLHSVNMRVCARESHCVRERVIVRESMFCVRCTSAIFYTILFHHKILAKRYKEEKSTRRETKEGF